MNTSDDPIPLRTLDASDVIRRLEGRAFNSGHFNPEEMTAKLVLEALLCGCSDISIFRRGDWWIVMSPNEWLTDEDKTACFTRTVTYPDGGPNSMRVEIFLTVFTKDVVTASLEVYLLFKGEVDSSLRDLVKRAREGGRLVAFRA